MEGLIFVLRKTSLTTLTEMWTERKTLHVEDCEAAGFRPAFSKKKNCGILSNAWYSYSLELLLTSIYPTHCISLKKMKYFKTKRLVMCLMYFRPALHYIKKPIF